MPNHTFYLERVPTETGTILLVTDERGRVRALDWHDHETRMTRLLRRHYGAEATVQPSPTRTRARAALERYFSGQLLR